MVSEDGGKIHPGTRRTALGGDNPFLPFSVHASRCLTPAVTTHVVSLKLFRLKGSAMARLSYFGGERVDSRIPI